MPHKPLSAVSSVENLPSIFNSVSPPPADTGASPGIGHGRPYRFSFYSHALSATIHARSLSELPADGQTFEELFSGTSKGSEALNEDARNMNSLISPLLDAKREVPLGTNNTTHAGTNGNGSSKIVLGDLESHTWWLDVLSPTDEEMQMLSKVPDWLTCPGVMFLTLITIGVQHPSPHD